MKAVAEHPHEARVQRYAYAALGAAVVVGVLDALASNGRLLGVEVPLVARLGLVLAGAVVGAIAVSKRSSPVALAAGALLVLGVVPAGALEPGLVGYARGFALGALVLAFHELVAQTARYDRAHKLVEEEAASEASLDKVTDEALKTLVARVGLALALAFAAVVGAVGLARVGPPVFRDTIETASPLGVAVVALLVLGALSLVILARGATIRASTPSPSQTSEVAADVPE